MLLDYESITYCYLKWVDLGLRHIRNILPNVCKDLRRVLVVRKSDSREEKRAVNRSTRQNVSVPNGPSLAIKNPAHISLAKICAGQPRRKTNSYAKNHLPLFDFIR